MTTRRHKPTTGDIILSRADRAGIHSIPELARRAGIPRATMYKRLSDEAWSLAELRALDRVVGFDDADRKDIMEG